MIVGVTGNEGERHNEVSRSAGQDGVWGKPLPKPDVMSEQLEQLWLSAAGSGNGGRGAAAAAPSPSPLPCGRLLAPSLTLGAEDVDPKELPPPCDFWGSASRPISTRSPMPSRNLDSSPTAPST